MACLSVFTADSKQRYVPDPPHQRGHLSFPSSSCIYVPHLEMISHAHQLKRSMVRSWSSLGSSWARQSRQRFSSPSWRKPWQVFNLHLSLMLPQQWHLRTSSLAASRVFVRRDGYHGPLQTTWDGPYKVLQRSRHVFRLQVGSREETVSTHRLKTAHVASGTPDGVPRKRGRPKKVCFVNI